ncbi:MAG: TPM domain-containing protein [Proteobacteria bacterium]|nr:TPM domain-containing protein [Pseudomonadota bacterium]MBU1058395.1 TPM domain-containing protein [Pseudomonadota bacterium]
MKSVSAFLWFKLFVVLSLLAGLPCFAPPLAALNVPTLKGRVNDTAAMLSQETIANLNRTLASFETSDSTQIVVLTIPSLEGEVLEEFAIKVVEAWKIGQKDLDNGALLLVSRDDRKIRIEVGYGLEGRLTDLVSGRIISGVIVPMFKKGRFDQGISDGVTAMMQAVKGEFTASASPAGAKNAKNDPAGLFFLLFFAYTFIGNAFRKKNILAAGAGGLASPLLGVMFLPQLGLWLLALIPLGMVGGLVAAALALPAGKSSGRSGGFYMGSGGGGSSGGFGGFSGGGGGFGGGGASGRW